MNQLQTFYNNENQRELVREFMVDTLKEMAIEKTFEGQATLGIQEAKECIDKMFSRLSDTYGKVEPEVITNSK